MTKDKLLRYCPLPLVFGFAFALSTLTASAQGTYKEVEVRDGSTITGVVKFVGTLPDLSQFDVTKNPEQCGQKKQFDRLILGKNNGIKNAVICLEGITEGKRFPSNTKYTINQKNCEYIPHVQVVPVGAPLQIVNSDNILHNVHAYTYGQQVHTVCNIAQPIKGQCTTLKQSQLGKAGVVLTTCDAGHPWMTGSLILCEHPYYVVTDNEGRFTMTDVPPGTYKIKMWHEGFKILSKEIEKGTVKKYNFEDPYEIVKSVSVSIRERVSVNFELAAR
jgi:hypothetical protein